MDSRKIAMMILKLTVKMVVIAALVAVCYFVCVETFEYGDKLFSQDAMAARGQGEDKQIFIPKGTTAAELGKILEENGLIEDAGIFKVQAMLYELTITPGEYVFNTEHNVEDIIDIINAAEPDA